MKSIKNSSNVVSIEQYRAPERARKLRRVGDWIADKGSQLNVEGFSPLSKTQAREIFVGLGQRLDMSASLSDRTGNRKYFGYMDNFPLVTHEFDDGSKRELTHLVFVDSTVLGITRTVDVKQVQDVGVTLLPIGANRNSMRDPVQLFGVNTHDFVKPHTIGLGKTTITSGDLAEFGNQKLKTNNDALLGVEFRVDFDKAGKGEGILELENISGQGDRIPTDIEVMTELDFGEDELGNYILPNRQHHMAVYLIGSLENSPHLWVPEVKQS